MKNEELAEKIVNQSLSIGRKRNPGIDKAKEKYGKDLINKIREGKLEKENEAIKELSKVEYGPLVYLDEGKMVLKDKVGHSVVITCNENNFTLAKEIERKCLKNGAHPIIITTNAERTREKYQLPPEDTLMELDPITASLSGKTDYALKVEPIENKRWKKEVSRKRMKTQAPVRQKINEISDEAKVKWSYIGWPHEETSKDLEVTHEEFKEILNESMEESFNPNMIELTEAWYRKLEGTEEILIEHQDGTKLELGVKGRHFLKDDGVLSEEDIERGDIGMNFPCGEIFIAPLETRANGKIFIPKTTISDYGTVMNLWLHMEKGKLVDYSAEENEDYLKRFLDENTKGINTIAELGIGCNKKSKYTGGYTLIDEKILGTIHIAIGWNKGFGGTTQSSAHHDFIKPMEKGRMYADGELVMEKGRIVED